MFLPLELCSALFAFPISHLQVTKSNASDFPQCARLGVFHLVTFPYLVCDFARFLRIHFRIKSVKSLQIRFGCGRDKVRLRKGASGLVSQATGFTHLKRALSDPSWLILL